MMSLIPIIVLLTLTLGFCAILYPPLTEKIKAHERLYRINRFRKTYGI
ncbi:hypothetical protein OR1_04102 [Geobacter sp. OR-1]|nr:hypothetical protein OR1_04102 [Geobacter sp. OR-1]